MSDMGAGYIIELMRHQVASAATPPAGLANCAPSAFERHRFDGCCLLRAKLDGTRVSARLQTDIDSMQNLVEHANVRLVVRECLGASQQSDRDDYWGSQLGAPALVAATHEALGRRPTQAEIDTISSAMEDASSMGVGESEELILVILERAGFSPMLQKSAHALLLQCRTSAERDSRNAAGLPAGVPVPSPDGSYGRDPGSTSGAQPGAQSRHAPFQLSSDDSEDDASSSVRRRAGWGRTAEGGHPSRQPHSTTSVASDMTTETPRKSFGQGEARDELDQTCDADDESGSDGDEINEISSRAEAASTHRGHTLAGEQGKRYSSPSSRASANGSSSYEEAGQRSRRDCASVSEEESGRASVSLHSHIEDAPAPPPPPSRFASGNDGDYTISAAPPPLAPFSPDRDRTSPSHPKPQFSSRSPSTSSLGNAAGASREPLRSLQTASPRLRGGVASERELGAGCGTDYDDIRDGGGVEQGGMMPHGVSSDHHQRPAPTVPLGARSIDEHGRFELRGLALHDLASLVLPFSSDADQDQSMLHTLDLACNQLRALSPDFFSLIPHGSLKVLDLSHNLLVRCSLTTTADQAARETVPDRALSLPSSLERLDLSHNRILRTDGLQGLINLRVLRLASNQLRSCSGTEGLIGLEELDLSDNKIANALSVRSLACNHALRRLELKGNPLASAAWCVQNHDQHVTTFVFYRF